MGIQTDISPSAQNLACTRILDCGSPNIQVLAREISQRSAVQLDVVRAAHLRLVQSLTPVYSVDEWQPASATLRKGRGSCSQRMACLEAVARAGGIATRVHAFWITGGFWYPRFPLARFFIPREVLLVWPQFLVDGNWLDFDELHAPMSRLVTNPDGFTNEGESLFEAVEHVPVDFCGKSCRVGGTPQHDLSRFVTRDGGWFDSRDEAFETFGSFQSTLRGRVFELIYGGRKSS